MLKKWAIILSGILFCMVLFYCLFHRPKPIVLTLVPQAYQSVSHIDEIDEWQINMYINQKQTYITDVDRIIHSWISDQLGDEVHTIEVVSIDFLETVQLNRDTYYAYIFFFRIKYHCSAPLTWYHARLSIQYDTQTTIDIHFGSFSLYKYQDNPEDIRITRMKGIINWIFENKLLVGVWIQMDRLVSQTIEINQIEVLDVNVQTNEIRIYTDMNEGFNVPINEFLQSPNGLKDIIDDDDSFIMGNDPILVTLQYEQMYELYCVGLRIDYTINHQEKSLFIDDFLFYTNQERYVSVDQLVMYVFEHD